MTLNDYQKEALSTAVYGSGSKIIYPTLGLAGEAGEVADKVKKVLRDNNGEFDEWRKIQIAAEIGDVLWYIAALSDDLGFTLEDIAKLNIGKLSQRRANNTIHGEGDNR
jgi:NTP pyrophosphatase (non-canonical NTP hydrolase)